jgi:hypothetical protein
VHPGALAAWNLHNTIRVGSHKQEQQMAAKTAIKGLFQPAL